MAKNKMLPYSPELSKTLEGKIREWGYSVEKKKMFGHEVFFSNGYMFSGANVDGIFVHIGQEARDEALKQETGVAPFEPMKGMVMREYLLLERPVYSKDHRLKMWLQTSYDFLNARPPKKKTKRK